MTRRWSIGRPQLKPSSRGEYEITDLNMSYLEAGELHVELLGRGFAWFDAGTHASLLEASQFVHTIQRRQGQLVASPEEVAFNANWIDRTKLSGHAVRFGKTDYGKALEAVAEIALVDAAAGRRPEGSLAVDVRPHR